MHKKAVNMHKKVGKLSLNSQKHSSLTKNQIKTNYIG